MVVVGVPSARSVQYFPGGGTNCVHLAGLFENLEVSIDGGEAGVYSGFYQGGVDILSSPKLRVGMKICENCPALTRHALNPNGASLRLRWPLWTAHSYTFTFRVPRSFTEFTAKAAA